MEKAANRQNKKQQKNTKRKQCLILGIMLIVFVALLGSFAWYLYQAAKRADSKDAGIMTPYYLYLLNEDGTESLELSIGNLYPGETKQVIIGVSNKAAGQKDVDYLVGKNTEFSYELELAYTRNMPLQYSVHELVVQPSQVEGAIQIIENGFWYLPTELTQSADSTTVTQNNNKEMYGETATEENIVNYVQYDLYDKDSGNNDLSLTTAVLDGGETTYDLDYYLIEISWQAGISFDDYLKETDLIYVIVKAMQPRPEETQSQEP